MSWAIFRVLTTPSRPASMVWLLPTHQMSACMFFSTLVAAGFMAWKNTPRLPSSTASMRAPSTLAATWSALWKKSRMGCERS